MLSWFALQVEPLREERVEKALVARGFETYLPLSASGELVGVRRRKKALFDGYVFCKFDPDSRQILAVCTPGVYRIVGTGRNHVPISEEEINQIRRAVLSGFPLRVSPRPVQGCRAVVVNGPLQGLKGIVIQEDHRDEFVLELRPINASVHVSVNEACLKCVCSECSQSTARVDMRSSRSRLHSCSR